MAAIYRLKTVQMPTGCVEIHGHCATNRFEAWLIAAANN